MREIILHHPQINGNDVVFRWESEPETELYSRPFFMLRFPAGMDLGRVPEGLWWRIAIICLHSHWILLRPCRIRLPISLEPGEAELWLRLMDAEIATLEAYRGTTPSAREIEIVEEGPRPEPEAIADIGRAATAFSGGKDSLLQTGLLSELTERPLLVATTSPVPWREDHSTARRREILAEIIRRRPVDLIEVESDYRANLSELYAQKIGYPAAVNELTDTFLYLGAMIAAGAANGATHFFMASETEVQENAELNGRVIQHKHFMYSLITLRAISEAIKPWGLRLSSLTPPLHSFQVQRLLWRRYEGLRDLQYSCWSVSGADWACNACSQCLRIALSITAMGENPGICGMNLTRVLVEMRGWQARRRPSEDALPGETVSARLHAQVLRSVMEIPFSRLTATLLQGRLRRIATGSFWKALLAFIELRIQAMNNRPGASPGYRAGFSRFIDPLVAGQVDEIYAGYFSPEDEAMYAQVLARSDRSALGIAEPMHCERLGDS